MASSITGDTKKVLLDQFKQDLDSSGSRYFIGISGADSTGVGLLGQMRFRNEMQFVKIVSANSFVVKTYNWTSGEIYNAYDNENINQEKFYVVNDLNEVFLCVQTDKNASGIAQPSTVKPTAALAASYDNTRRSFPTSDGYVWRYLYQMSGLAVNRFKTNDYMPVQQIKSPSSISQLNEQRTLQNESIDGEIIGIAIDSGGTGYQFAPRLEIEGNGTGASFSATLNNGKIVAVTVDSDGFGTISHGSGYDYAKIVPTGTGGAVLRPIIGPKGGVNLDPVATLRADQFMVQTTIQDDENGTIPLADPTNDFKSVALVRKPNTYGSQADYTASVGNAMNYFTVSGGSGTFTADEIFETSAQVKAKTHWHDTSNNRLYYVQNDSTGFGTFNVSDTISSTTTSTAKDIDAINNPQIDRYSGEILYINTLNSTIDRTSTQTEDIRVVIDLGQD